MHTTEQASNLVCPQPEFNMCLANRCMAWRWVSSPVLTFRKVVSYHTYRNYTEEYGGHLAPRHEYQLLSLDPIKWFPELVGWTKDGEPWFDTEDWYWCQDYTRTEDPNAAGYCGLAGKP